MYKFFIFLSAVILLTGIAGCSKDVNGDAGEDSRGNAVNINGIDIDDSTNYKYLFREEIKKERAKKQVTDEEYFK